MFFHYHLHYYSHYFYQYYFLHYFYYRYYYYFRHYHNYYYLYYQKYLALKVDQLRQVRRPGNFLTQAVKQPYSACCLTKHVFEGYGSRVLAKI